MLLGRAAQSVACLATDTCLTADPWVASWKPGLVTIISWRLIVEYFLLSFSSLPQNHSRMVVVSNKRKYVHEVLVNRLFTFAQEKLLLDELNVPP